MMIYTGVATPQKRIKLETWWLGYSQNVEEYIKRCKKCKESRNFTFMAQRNGAMELCTYGSCIYYLSETPINTSRLFFWLT